MEVKFTRFRYLLKFPCISVRRWWAVLGRWPYVVDLVVLGQFLGWRVSRDCRGQPTPFTGCHKSCGTKGWVCRRGVFNELLAVLSRNVFMTDWWWVVTTWRKTPRKPERGVLSAVGVVAAPGSRTRESPALLSGWIIRNDRLGNVGIKLKCELCQKPQPNQNQSTSTGVWGCVFFFSFCFVGCFTLNWNLFRATIFCLLALGECSGCEPCTCVCLTTFREFFDNQVVIDGKNRDGMWGYAYLLLFTSKNKKRQGGGTSLAFYFNP